MIGIEDQVPYCHEIGNLKIVNVGFSTGVVPTTVEQVLISGVDNQAHRLESGEVLATCGYNFRSNNHNLTELELDKLAFYC